MDFYGFTAHPRQSPFERVVQALIFTALIQPLAAGFRMILIGSNEWWTIGVWSEAVGFGWSVVLAFVVGLGATALSNNSLPHDWLPGWVTKRTSSPSEWYSALARYPRFVCLRLEDGRTLWGWPEEWPDASDGGHFLIKYPCWLLNDGRRIELPLAEAILLPAALVENIEFELAQDDLTEAVKAGNEAARRELLSLRQEQETTCPPPPIGEDDGAAHSSSATPSHVKATSASPPLEPPAHREFQQEPPAAGSDGSTRTSGGAAASAEGEQVEASPVEDEIAR